METYKQNIKEKCRKIVWETAISHLTKNREESKILRKDIIGRIWEYAFKEVLVKHRITPMPKDSYLINWFDFSDSRYGQRRPQDLRVAYFCGPEPENDLSEMIKYGIRPENIYAFEIDKVTYRLAINKIKDDYQTIKVFFGKIDNFIQVYPEKFDIVYLDFTGPMYSRTQQILSTIHSIFDTQALDDLSILIVNTSLPNLDRDALSFTTSYFLHQPFIEGTAIGSKTQNGEPVTWFDEGPLAHSLNFDLLAERVKQNWADAYSAFSTHYPMTYASIIQPPLRVLSNSQIKRIIFNMENSILQNAVEKMNDISSFLTKIIQREDVDPDFEGTFEDMNGGDLIFSSDEYPIWHFINCLKEHPNKLNDYWFDYFRKDSQNKRRYDAIQFTSILRTYFSGYEGILSDTLKNALPHIIESVPDKRSGLFCDIPFPHLWLEVALNQLGYPYHPNIDFHSRYTYTAKTRQMMTDIFLFDKCRAMYDWLPTIEFYSTDLSKIERQMLIRCCLERIGKQCRWVIPYLYSGSSIIEGYGTESWADFGELKEREIIV